MKPRLTNILTPETEREIFTQTLLPLILAGENATVMYVPQGGRRRSVVYLTENSEKLGFKKLGKYLILHVDPNELAKETPSSYFTLVREKIQEKAEFVSVSSSSKPFAALKKTVKEVLDQKYHLILTLRKFEELKFPKAFFNNLAYLWELDKTKVHFIFPVCQDILKRLKTYGALREVIAQNLVFFPLLSTNDQDLVMKKISRKYGYPVSQKPALIKKLSGGNPSLIKACLRILSKHKDLKNEEKITSFLFDQYEIKLILEDIWKSLEKDEQGVVSALANHLPLKTEDIPIRLSRLGLVQELKLFSPLFTLFVKAKTQGLKKITLDEQTGQVLINGLPIKEKLTLQEYHLLSAFLEKPGLVYSRDDIADTLWGKESYDKYSDWAIDQIISRLRKTLSNLGISPSNLQTIRKRGYRWLGENAGKSRN